MRAKVSMREALADPALLGGAIPGPSWKPWRTLLIASMGEALTDDEREIYTAITGREREPLEPVEELAAITGRRSGKTRASGVLAAFVGGLCDHRDALAPGERASLPILAASQHQASRCFMHARGVLEHSPVLSQEIVDVTSDTIRLKTRVDIEVRPASFKTIRGITAVAAICDEVAFWMIEGTSNPDSEILNALRPSLATTGGPLWLISSPYAKKGELYEAFRRHYGPVGDAKIIVAKAPSRAMNSTLPQSVIDRAYERDAAAASSEYGGEFRNDLEAFVDRDAVAACVVPDRIELPPRDGLNYRAFIDPAGGGADSFTMAIGHREGDRCVVDAVRERKGSPEAIVADYATLLKTYRVGSASSDRYGGRWPSESLARHGIRCVPSEQPKSDLYRDALPVLNSGRVELLDLPKLIDQFANLERRVARGGRESIDHAPHAHDDVANAIAGLIGLCIRAPQPVYPLVGNY